MKSRNKELDILKGLLIIIVVIRHVFQVVALDTDVDYLSNLMTIVEMPLFILVSGYFVGKSLLTQNKELLGVIKKKTIAYLIPFLSYYFIFKMLFSPISEWNGMVIALIHNITHGLWFLFVVWILSIVLNIAICISSRHRLSNVVKVAIFTMAFFGIVGCFGLIGLKFGFDFLGAKYIVFYSVLYYLGYLFHYLISVKRLLANDGFVAVCTVIFFIGANYFKILLLPDSLVYMGIRIVLALAGAGVLYRIAVYLSEKGKTLKLDVIGMFTLEIYYVHSFLLRVIDFEAEAKLMSYDAILKALVLAAFLMITIPIIITVIRNNKVLSVVVFGKTH